ncbi:hypothetical protein [Candidatus Poriferisodalis sp.]|uniref:aromatic-ring hydroxylase C-terminal domain-containing protein n=1 Tax=Candidatus Poriferisodalis sp. TaxID=3101277 RepID=UPI003D143965
MFESGDATAEQVREALEASARYGNWLGMDLGLHYEQGCLIGDGTPPPQVNDPVSDYAPTARPGQRGAVLIRPDGHVAWRDPHATTAAAMAALDTLLAQ